MGKLPGNGPDMRSLEGRMVVFETSPTHLHNLSSPAFYLHVIEL